MEMNELLIERAEACVEEAPEVEDNAGREVEDWRYGPPDAVEPAVEMAEEHAVVARPADEPSAVRRWAGLCRRRRDVFVLAGICIIGLLLVGGLIYYLVKSNN